MLRNGTIHFTGRQLGKDARVPYSTGNSLRTEFYRKFRDAGKLLKSSKTSPDWKQVEQSAYFIEKHLCIDKGRRGWGVEKKARVIKMMKQEHTKQDT